MKNKLLVLAMLLNVSVGNSQIRNLNDVLVISEMGIEEVISNLQQTWELHDPIQQISNDRTAVTETYAFTYKRNGKNQAIRRTVKADVDSGYRYEVTKFIFNDADLYKLITGNIKYRGFVFKEKNSKTGVSSYSDGSNFIYVNPDYKVRNSAVKTSGKLFKITVGVL